MLHTLPNPTVDGLSVDWVQLVIAAVMTLGLTTVVAVIIRRPLDGVLQLVCGTEVSARFWTTFALVLLVMGPLFLVFTAAGGAVNLADFVRRTVYLVSFGVIGAFLVMGAAVMLSAPSQALARRRAEEISGSRQDASVVE
jgi:hypothetical protein